MVRNLEDLDFTHGLLLSTMLPLLLAPPGSVSGSQPRLRGIVRVDDGRSRVALTRDPAMQSGVAFDVSLTELHRDEGRIEVDSVLAHLRSITADELDRYTRDAALPCDVHGNRLVSLAGEGLAAASRQIAPEQELFTVFQLMQRGPVRASVRDVFRFTGFMLRGNGRCRIYVSLVDNGTSYGLDVPLQRAGGDRFTGMAASFETELTMKLGNDGELYEPITDRSDEYCTLAYELDSWLNPSQG